MNRRQFKEVVASMRHKHRTCQTSLASLTQLEFNLLKSRGFSVEVPDVNRVCNGRPAPDSKTESLTTTAGQLVFDETMSCA
jgi:hypothetical protein